MLFIVAERKFFPESATSPLTPVVGRPRILSLSCTTALSQHWFCCSCGCLSSSSFLSSLCISFFLFCLQKKLTPPCVGSGSILPLIREKLNYSKQIETNKTLLEQFCLPSGTVVVQRLSLQILGFEKGSEMETLCFCLLTQSSLGAHQFGRGSGVSCSQCNQVQECN